MTLAFSDQGPEYSKIILTYIVDISNLIVISARFWDARDQTQSGSRSARPRGSSMRDPGNEVAFAFKDDFQSVLRSLRT